MARIVLWVDGVLDQGQDAIEKALAEIGPTAFMNVVFCGLHVQPDGSLVYNGTPVAQLWSGLSGALKAFLQKYETSTITLAIGGPGFESDFINAAGAASAFGANLASFCATCSATVVGLDFCGPYTAQYADALVATTKAVHAQDAVEFMMAAADYTQMAWWVEDGGVLSQTTDSDGQMFAAMNLKFFDSGSNLAPGEWLDQFGLWMTELVSNTANKIDDGTQFLVAGCNAVAGFTLANFTQGIDSVASSYPRAGGGFVYDYSEIQGNVAAWAHVVWTAFNGGPKRPITP